MSPDDSIVGLKPESQDLAALILAAGKGTRMRSEKPKVLHELMGRPLIAHLLNAVRYLNPKFLVVVTGYGAEEVEQAVASFQPIFVRQPKMLGTGHAVSCAAEVLSAHRGPVVILPGDAPLISPQTLLDFTDAHRFAGADLSVLTVRLAQPGSYGRIVRDRFGWIERIVEARDATERELAIDEINSGFYIVDGPALFEAISSLKPDNDQKEYYLTDVVAEFRQRGLLAAAIEGPDPLEIQGVNDRRDLATAQNILKNRINDSWLTAGVTMIDPEATYIEPKVRLAKDVVLWPGVILTGSTTVGEGAFIGPYSFLKDCRVEPRAQVSAHQNLIGVIVESPETQNKEKAPLGQKKTLNNSSSCSLRAPKTAKKNKNNT
ncbi:MAG: NTP transferase domain-containing protein [Deltaproteobacteria bacterium]|jgi:bifunctional UDP-N-acetylglucosamine pyrophosphorylase/glucosamine-1-phosphate N-acetyltransferase|nr:NTP transferase domain-containing protein [Deltaproteobacteria bacterium]